jgi:carboxymethylenebutenolidase
MIHPQGSQIMSSSEVTIKGKHGDFMAYLSGPAGGGPGIVVVQEIFGVNKWLRDTCDMLAGKGYMAIAPDLFWPIQPGVQLDPMVEADFNTGLDLYGKFNVDNSIDDIQSTITVLRGRDGCNGKVGVTGFCLGGLLTYLSVARTDADAGSAYYGVGIDGLLGEAGRIKAPTLIHIADEDAFVPKEASNQVREALEGHGVVSVHTYPGCNHGFARDSDANHYDKAATELAHGRTFDLFKSTLS